MGYTFNGSTQYFSATRPISAYPFTFACWFKPDTITSLDMIMSAGFGTGNGFGRYELKGLGTTSDAVEINNGGASDVAATTTFSSGSWQLAVGVWSGSSARAVYYNGASKGTSAVPDDIQNNVLDALRIGGRARSLVNAFFDGALAEAAVWSVALSDAEVLSLFSGGSGSIGLSADQVQSGNLVGYWKLLDGDGGIDYAASNDLTTPGTAPSTTSDHPSIDYGGGGGTGATRLTQSILLKPNLIDGALIR